MKKIDKIMENVDRQIDRKFGPVLHFFRKYFVIFSSTFLALLLSTFLFKVYYNKPYFTASLVKGDLKSINEVLHKIDKECNILSIKGDRILLDFLTVKSFHGSAVGGMNFAYPAKWRGPYLKQNLVLQQYFYELVRAKDGFFIIPGVGVKLPNGFTVGKDFKINRYIDVLPMLQPGGEFFFKGFFLAKQVSFKIGDWDPVYRISDETIEEISDILKEFNTAIPFSHNNEREARNDTIRLKA